MEILSVIASVITIVGAVIWVFRKKGGGRLNGVSLDNIRWKKTIGVILIIIFVPAILYMLNVRMQAMDEVKGFNDFLLSVFVFIVVGGIMLYDP